MTNTTNLPRPKPFARTCQTCLHWDLAEGQQTLRDHAAFFAAAQHISPNQMATTAIDSDGQPNEGRKKLPQLEDKWSYMGACMGRGELRHRIDTCKHWRSGGFGRLLGKRPGDGYPTAAETAQEQVQ